MGAEDPPRDHENIELGHEKQSYLAQDGLLSTKPPPARKIFAQLIELFTPDAFSRRKGVTKRLGPTAWLDGLRGWAALCVCFMHLTVYTHEGLELCYGSKFVHSDEHNVSPAALPIIRLPFTGGHFSVMLFFVISGYVVPRRLIQILNEGRSPGEFIDNLHSALIRRPVRLFLPVILSTAMFATIWHATGVTIPWPQPKSNFIFEFWNWIEDISTFLYFFKIGYLYTYYNVHTWTIPVEYRGSMFLFIFIFMTNNVKTKTRVYLMLIMVLHLSIGSPGAWYACFFAGMLMSQLEMISQEAGNRISFPWDNFDKWFRSQKAARNIFLHLLLLAGLYLATQPSSDWSTREKTLGECPGWITLSHMIPKSYLDEFSQFRWFWLFWAASIVVYCVREIAWLRACFEMHTAQYLGKHSFALYLVHGPLIGLVSERLFYLTGLKQPWTQDQKDMFGMYQNKWRDSPLWPFPERKYPTGLEPDFLVCVVISIPIMFYVAEIGTRLFDEPSAKASKWVWQKWKTL